MPSRASISDCLETFCLGNYTGKSIYKLREKMIKSDKNRNASLTKNGNACQGKRKPFTGNYGGITTLEQILRRQN